LAGEKELPGASLVLKSTRCTEANRVPKRKARVEGARIMDARPTSMQKILKAFHILQSIFRRNKPNEYIREMIRNQYNY